MKTEQEHELNADSPVLRYMNLLRISSIYNKYSKSYIAMHKPREHGCAEVPKRKRPRGKQDSTGPSR